MRSSLQGLDRVIKRLKPLKTKKKEVKNNDQTRTENNQQTY